MVDTDCDSSQWEFSKENIQPIKQGRKATILTQALDESQQQKLSLERQGFEKELRLQSNPDPLDVWYRYALWIEQNYPKGGKDANLFKLIESCFTSLQSSDQFERYKGDERFLDLWLKYINFCPSPLEVYQSLNSQGFFNKLVTFYENWAYDMEKIGNYKKADAIYEEGIRNVAQPKEDLLMARNKFQMRVTTKSISEITVANENENIPNSESQRIVLSKLKCHGLKVKAPVERANAVLGTAGRVNTSASASSNSYGQGFQIFQDENSEISQRDVISSEKGAFASQSSIAKENSKSATVWSKKRVPQKTTGVIPVEDVDYFVKPKYTVYMDDNSSTATIQTPSKPSFTNALSSLPDEEEWKVPLYVSEPFNPKAQPQYDKHLVYCGTEEFSFEELRALNYFRLIEIEKKEHREKMQKEEEKMRIQEMEEQEKRIREINEQENQKVMNEMEKRIQEIKEHENQKVKNEIEELKKMLKQQQEVISHLSQSKANDSSMKQPPVFLKVNNSQINSSQHYQDNSALRKPDHQVYEDSWVGINKSTSFAQNRTVNISHGLEDNNTKALLQFQPNQIDADASCDGMLSPPKITSFDNVENVMPPSPTMNTKMAKNLVKGLFCGSILSSSSTDMNSFEQFDPPKVDILTSSSQIYQDEKSLINTPDLSTSAKFEIFSDPEPPKSVPFEIFSDNPTPAANFNIFSDSDPQQMAAYHPAHGFESNALQPKSVETKVIPAVDNEDQENIPPSNYAQAMEKRQISGILQPSINIPFVPLDEQKKEELKTVQDNRKRQIYEVEEVRGAQRSFFEEETMAVPLSQEAFAQNAMLASTPCPWAMGLVKQSAEEECTMALQFKKALGDKSENSNRELSSNTSDPSEENSGSLMPPPPVTTGAEVMAGSGEMERKVANATMAENVGLSPITELSGEYKSSTSSSSGGSCLTLGGHSNFLGNGPLGRTLNFSRSWGVSQCETEPYNSVLQSDATKSGYFADKSSRGESLQEIRGVGFSRCQRSTRSNEIKNSSELEFDSKRIAGALLGLGDTPQNKEKKSLIQPEVKEVENVKSPLEGPPILYPAKIDPFSSDLHHSILSSLKLPVEKRGGFVKMMTKMPQIKPKMKLNIGNELFHVRRQRGTGSYAQVYQASTVDPMNVTVMPSNLDDSDDENSEEQMILKIQRPPFHWEFYICHELRERLKAAKYSTSVIESIMRVNRGYFFEQGSILVSEYHKYGSLINVMNSLKKSGRSMTQAVVIYLMIEILTVVDALHSNDIIHGDMKPDNIVLTSMPEVESFEEGSFMVDGPKCVKLIDFGRSIDMKVLPEGTTFIQKVSTDGFICGEMRNGLPWTYQTDYFGLAGVAHILLWSSYMNVKQIGNKWSLSGVNFQRNWKKFWPSFFEKMLNIPSCNQLPDLKEIIKEFKHELLSEKVISFKRDCQNISSALVQYKS